MCTSRGCYDGWFAGVAVPGRVQVNVANLAFCNNLVTTSKYTLWSFVPRSIFEQFRRVANVYFLGISILMIIGTYAPTVFASPLLPFSTIGPLILVLVITMAKEGAEDLKRHRSDKEINNRKVSVLTPGGPDLETTWLELRVGQVIRVHNKHEVRVCVAAWRGRPFAVLWRVTSPRNAACAHCRACGVVLVGGWGAGWQQLNGGEARVLHLAHPPTHPPHFLTPVSLSTALVPRKGAVCGTGTRGLVCLEW